MTDTHAGQPRRRWPLVATAILGVAIAAAPLAFGMFTRAPKGGDMIAGFRPYMNASVIDRFRGDLATIGAAHTELHDAGASVTATRPALSQFDSAWPGIDADMGSMLTTMRANIDNYSGVAALPPFVLFPWFFVVPGLLVFAASIVGLRSRESGWPRVALAVLGLGLIAAPAVFGMFTRAPGGSHMIEAFKPFMTQDKVAQIQGYFLTIGYAEGDLRLGGLDAISRQPGVTEADLVDITALGEQWPRISSQMAPMIGAMADNVGNYDAVVAMPPFWQFPWFFVVPGVLITGLALAVRQPAGRPLPLPSRSTEGVLA